MKPIIGRRWKPNEHIAFSTNGNYEHMNPSVYVTRDESMLQAALLDKSEKPKRGVHPSTWAIIVIGIVGMYFTFSS